MFNYWHPVHIVVDAQLDFADIVQNLVYAQNYTSRKYCATDKNLLLSRNSMLTQIQHMSKRIVCCEKSAYINFDNINIVIYTDSITPAIRI